MYMNTKILFCLLIAASGPLAGSAQPTEAPRTGTPAAPPQSAAPGPGNLAGLETNTVQGGHAVETLSFDYLPLPDAIQQLGKMAGLNIEIDPALLNQKAADGTSIPPPIVTEKWKQVTPLQAMQALLDNYGWQMQLDANSPKVLIRSRDTNATAPLRTKVNLLDKAPSADAATASANAARGYEGMAIAFDDEPLPDAIRQLANLEGLNIQFDPLLLHQQDANHHAVPTPTLNRKYNNVTPRQMLQTLLDTYAWQMTQIPGNPIFHIEARNSKAGD
jgi:hypothetical protein